MRRLLGMFFFANLGFLYPTYTLFLLSRELNLTEILSLESVLFFGKKSPLRHLRLVLTLPCIHKDEACYI
jgi:hypothetical protein